MAFEKHLIRKYNVPGPRYTSYPTVPYWKSDTFDTDKWLASVATAFNESNDEEGISIYIHLPFCESLCTFCGCHKHITCLLYTSPSPRDRTRSRMPSSA